MFKPMLPVFRKALSNSSDTRIIDLASGGGGGLIWLNEHLRSEFPQLRITLTDYYPNLRAFKYTCHQSINIDFISTPVDAREVPAELTGLRTQFLSFHHFKSADARMILQNAVDSKSPILIIEGQERSIPSIIAMLFSPITLLLVTPFIRPFRWGRLVFTYLIPIVPLFVWWDGIVSALRTYSVKEMKQLVSELDGSHSFHWEIERIKSGPGVNLYLLGEPILKN